MQKWRGKARLFIGVFLISMLMLTGLTGCGQSQNQSGQPKPADNGQTAEIPKLKIGSLTLEENLPILVAEKNGYFAAEKMQVELVPFQSPVELQSAFQAGQLDGTITDIMIAALLKSAGEDLRVTSIALGATPTEGRFAIVASPKSDIKTVKDLKGKSIGISSNSIIEYVTDGLLQAGGLTPADVKKVTVAKIPLRLEMLLNNQIDAIVVPDPQISHTVAKGAKVIAEDTKGENLSQSVHIMSSKTISAKKDALSRFYTAYAKAVDDINQTPDQYKELLVKTANVPTDIVTTYKVQRYSKPQLPVEKDVTKVLAWLKEKNLLKGEVNYQGFVQTGLY